MELEVAIPGLLISRDKFVLSVLSFDAVGVYVRRLDDIPNEKEVQRLAENGLWVVVHRTSGDDITVHDPSFRGGHYSFKTAEERESVEFAMSLAMHVWPEWCPHLRGIIQPRRDFLPLTAWLCGEPGSKPFADA